MDIESVYKQYFKDVFLYLRSLSADAGTAERMPAQRRNSRRRHL